MDAGRDWECEGKSEGNREGNREGKGEGDREGECMGIFILSMRISRDVSNCKACQ